MTSFADTAFSEKANEEDRDPTNRDSQGLDPQGLDPQGLDPLFLRRQSLSEDLRRWSSLEERLSLLEQAAVSAKGLRSRQAAILRLVALEGGRMSVKALLLALRVSKQSLHGNLTELVRDGYVRKAGCERQDRRVRVLALTEKGMAFVEGLLEPRARLLRRAYRSAGAAQVEGFRRTLLLLSEKDAP